MFPHQQDDRHCRRAARRKRPLPAMLAGLWLLALVTAPPSRAQETGDWTLTCAEALCRLETPGRSEQTDAPAYRLFLLAEKSRAALSLGFRSDGPQPDAGRAMQWEVDGRLVHVLRPEAFAGFGSGNDLFVTDPAAGQAVMPALLRGQRLRISYIDALGEPHDAVFSLNGLAAGLAALAEKQDRTEKTPPPLAAPSGLERRAPPSRAAAVRALGTPPAVLYRHATTGDCESPESENMASREVVVGVLSPTSTVYAIPCTAGATGLTYRLYLRDSGEIGGVETLYFALHDPRFGWIGSDLLSGVSFDADKATLNAAFTGRSDRHCGYRASWRWSDYAFRLQSFRGPSDCAQSGSPKRWTSFYP